MRIHRLCIGFLAASGLMLVASVGTAGVTSALWTSTVQSGHLAVEVGQIGFAIEKPADGSRDVSVDGVPAQVTVGAAEADALVFAGLQTGAWATAVPFDVTMFASAGHGMDYSLAVGAPGQDGVFALAQIALFPVESAASCTAAGLGNATAYTSGASVTGIEGGTEPQTVTQHWCAVISMDPPTYTNTVVASGTAAGGSRVVTSEVDKDSTWTAILLPDAAGEQALPITATPTRTLGNAFTPAGT